MNFFYVFDLESMNNINEDDEVKQAHLERTKAELEKSKMRNMKITPITGSSIKKSPKALGTGDKRSTAQTERSEKVDMDEEFVEEGGNSSGKKTSKSKHCSKSTRFDGTV